MPYITFAKLPDTIGVGRSARNVSFQMDTLADWCGEVDEVMAGETEIDEATYTAQGAANAAHNAALPMPVAEPAPVEPTLADLQAQITLLAAKAGVSSVELSAVSATAN